VRFNSGRGAIGGAGRTSGLVGKIKPFQTLIFGAIDPALNGPERDLKTSRDGAHGMTAANGGNEL
jgi:hypothetical protein